MYLARCPEEQPPTTPTNSWAFPVGQWAHWAGIESPALAFVDPMLRRRLSPLARAVLHVANACVQDCPSASFVFASRHGELQRTVGLLHNLARDEGISPTIFSLSVLNSGAGVFSIARNDHAPATAVSAGVESFGFGLLEAHMRAGAAHERPVVYVYADAPAPDPLGHQRGDPDSVFALGILIDSKGTQRLHTEIRPHTACEGDSTLQADACLGALKQGTGQWVASHRRWHWSLTSGATPS